jgi:hypothetical protein
VITIADCSTLEQALRIRLGLDSVGIPTFMPDESAATVASHHFFTNSGVRVQVPDERAKEARRVLAELNEST